jgi:hypothetical protein
MTNNAARYRVSHPDRQLACQEAVESELREIIEKANMGGWGTIETMDAIEEIMRHLRLAYAEDPAPSEEPIMDARLFLHTHPGGISERP